MADIIADRRLMHRPGEPTLCEEGEEGAILQIAPKGAVIPEEAQKRFGLVMKGKKVVQVKSRTEGRGMTGPRHVPPITAEPGSATNAPPAPVAPSPARRAPASAPKKPAAAPKKPAPKKPAVRRRPRGG